MSDHVSLGVAWGCGCSGCCRLCCSRHLFSPWASVRSSGQGPDPQSALKHLKKLFQRFSANKLTVLGILGCDTEHAGDTSVDVC